MLLPVVKQIMAIHSWDRARLFLSRFFLVLSFCNRWSRMSSGLRLSRVLRTAAQQQRHVRKAACIQSHVHAEARRRYSAAASEPETFQSELSNGMKVISSPQGRGWGSIAGALLPPYSSSCCFSCVKYKRFHTHTHTHTHAHDWERMRPSASSQRSRSLFVACLCFVQRSAH